MKKIFLTITAICLAGNVQVHAQATPLTDIYKAGQTIALRAPSVPLITSDTYLSIWSPYTQLTAGNTEHWTAQDHPLIGAIRVDGKTYRFMGKDTPNLPVLLPMTYSEAWEAAYTTDKPTGDWTATSYDDAKWKKGQAAFGTKGMARMKTEWNTKNIWIRRTFDINEDLTKENIALKYSHDDVFTIYLNGTMLLQTDYSWKDDEIFVLKDSAKKLLKKGKNVLAAHCENRAGGAYVDFGLFRKPAQASGFEVAAVQTAVNVLPTQTYYTFTCGPVELDLVFTSPLLLDDLELISTPISYISYRVRSMDKKAHNVQLYMETTPQLAVNDIQQAVTSERITKNNMVYLKTGTIDQPITKRIGDGTRIDWGYAYLASDNAANKALSLGDYYAMKDEFIASGKLKASTPSKDLSIHLFDAMTVLAYTEDLGQVNAGTSGYVMLGYDDIYSVEYFYKRKQAYWKHDGKVSIFDAFETAKKNHDSVMTRARAFDDKMMADALRDGGKEYAEMCALAYRQTIAAHKLVTDDEGNLLFLSKENHSNGCINTVDITYPSSPLFLLYNTELLKGMMTPIFYYSESGRWQKPFPAHDLGTYPIANGQLYGGDMPIEEGGNMLILSAAISLVDGNANYAKKHWETLTTWANYLADNGLDPENQLSTDDFSGHLAHNANLSIKAIMGIAGYGIMADMIGEKEVAQRYLAMARSMAVEWEKMANNGDHYRLAFDKAGTWSQKYNLIWDKIFKLNIFPAKVIATEIPFYLSKQNKYGLPLDSRETYTKSDWVFWSACLASDMNDFKKIIAPMYKYANETPTRVPLSDWHDTHTAIPPNFKARSVVGAYFIKMLENKVAK